MSAEEIWQKITPIITFLSGSSLAAIIVALRRFYISRKKIVMEEKTFGQNYINWMESRFKNIEADNAECLKVQNELRDRTEDLQNEISALRRTLDEFGSTIIAVVVADDTGHITDWSPAATALFHWTTEDAIGKPIHILAPPRLRQAHLLAFRKVTHDGGKPREEPLITVGITRDGKEINISIKLSSWQVADRWLYAAEIKKI